MLNDVPMKIALCCVGLAGVAFAARKPKPKPIETTGTMTKVVSCYGAVVTLPEPCKRDGAVQGIERLHVTFIHIPSPHATYDTVPYIGWASFSHHSVPVVGRSYKVKIEGDHLKWYIGDANVDDPAGPMIHPSWQNNKIEGVTLDPQKASGTTH